MLHAMGTLRPAEEDSKLMASSISVMARIQPPQSLWRLVMTDIGAMYRTTIVILTPLLLLPMLFQGSPEWRCGYCVIVLGVYWMCEVMPLAATAMLPVVIFPATGLITAKDVAKEYITDTNFLFIGGLIVAAAVEKADLHERIALCVLTHVGSQPKWIMFGFMSVTAFLSMFISNTATTAMMVPIAQSVTQQLIRSFRTRQTRRGSGIGSAELALQKATGETEKVEPITQIEKNLAKALLICICFAANIGGTGTLTGTPPNLVVVGQLGSLFPGAPNGVNYISFIGFAVPMMFFCLIACWFVLVLYFMRHMPPADDAITKLMKQRYHTLPPMSYAEKSVGVLFLALIFLWIGREPQVVPGFGQFFPKGCYTDATSAMLIAILLFVLPNERPDLFFWRKEAHDGQLPKPVARKSLMDWPTMQKNFPWSVVLLLGGGFALAKGVKDSGLSAVMGEALGRFVHLPTWGLQLLCVVATTAVTNICSNTATANIFLPIVASLAQQTDTHPLALMLPVTIACSFVFVLPVGTPPNAIVFASGVLKITDMMVVGLCVSVVTTAILILHMCTAAHIVFPLSEFPFWAIPSNATMLL